MGALSVSAAAGAVEAVTEALCVGVEEVVAVAETGALVLKRGFLNPDFHALTVSSPLLPVLEEVEKEVEEEVAGDDSTFCFRVGSA